MAATAELIGDLQAENSTDGTAEASSLDLGGPYPSASADHAAEDMDGHEEDEEDDDYTGWCSDEYLEPTFEPLPPIMLYYTASRAQATALCRMMNEMIEPSENGMDSNNTTGEGYPWESKNKVQVHSERMLDLPAIIEHRREEAMERTYPVLYFNETMGDMDVDPHGHDLDNGPWGRFLLLDGNFRHPCNSVWLCQTHWFARRRGGALIHKHGFLGGKVPAVLIPGAIASSRNPRPIRPVISRQNVVTRVFDALRGQNPQTLAEKAHTCDEILKREREEEAGKQLEEVRSVKRVKGEDMHTSASNRTCNDDARQTDMYSYEENRKDED